VSPTTLALCRSEPLRCWHWIANLILYSLLGIVPGAAGIRHEYCSSWPERMTPTRKPPSASTQSTIPTTRGNYDRNHASGLTPSARRLSKSAQPWRNPVSCSFHDPGEAELLAHFLDDQEAWARVTARMDSDENNHGNAPPSRNPTKTVVSEMRMDSNAPSLTRLTSVM